MVNDLFSQLAPAQSGGPLRRAREFAPGAWLFPARLLADDMADAATNGWDAALKPLLAQAPWRHWVTPGGRSMSVESSNCGTLGWVSDPRGYRYQTTDPESGTAWPALPNSWPHLVHQLAKEAGYQAFYPDSCLINRYQPDARMSLHQDRNEADFSQPIVSWSLGMTAVFLFGGLERQGPTHRLILQHGDVVVWGGPSRLAFHGIAPLKGPAHPTIGACRLNLTFRRAA